MMFLFTTRGGEPAPVPPQLISVKIYNIKIMLLKKCHCFSSLICKRFKEQKLFLAWYMIFITQLVKNYSKNYDFVPSPLPFYSSRYHPVTVHKSSWLNVTLRPWSWPHRPTTSLTVTNRFIYTVPYLPSLLITVPNYSTFSVFNPWPSL